LTQVYLLYLQVVHHDEQTAIVASPDHEFRMAENRLRILIYQDSSFVAYKKLARRTDRERKISPRLEDDPGVSWPMRRGSPSGLRWGWDPSNAL
jgi:hypothetical protein